MATGATATTTDSPKNGQLGQGTVVQRKATLPQTQAAKVARKSIMEVRPSDSSIWSGYLDMKTASKKSWDRRYFALQQDLVLYTFRTDKVGLYLWIGTGPSKVFRAGRLRKDIVADHGLPHIVG